MRNRARVAFVAAFVLAIFAAGTVSAHTATPTCDSITLALAPAKSTANVDVAGTATVVLDTVPGNGTYAIAAGTYDVHWSDGYVVHNVVVGACPTPSPSPSPTPSPSPVVTPTPSPSPVVTPTPNPCASTAPDVAEQSSCPTASPSTTPVPSPSTPTVTPVPSQPVATPPITSTGTDNQPASPAASTLFLAALTLFVAAFGLAIIHTARNPRRIK